jgi:hypothetical protein
MVTHDIHRPIPPSTVRISVILGGNSFTVDLPSAKLGATLQAFEDHSGPLSSDRCAAEAAGADDAHVVTSAALWLFLFQPGDQGIMNAGRLGEATRVQCPQMAWTGSMPSLVVAAGRAKGGVGN